MKGFIQLFIVTTLIIFQSVPLVLSQEEISEEVVENIEAPERPNESMTETLSEEDRSQWVYKYEPYEEFAGSTVYFRLLIYKRTGIHFQHNFNPSGAINGEYYRVTFNGNGYPENIDIINESGEKDYFDIQYTEDGLILGGKCLGWDFSVRYNNVGSIYRMDFFYPNTERLAGWRIIQYNVYNYAQFMGVHDKDGNIVFTLIYKYDNNHNLLTIEEYRPENDMIRTKMNYSQDGRLLSIDYYNPNGELFFTRHYEEE